MEYWVDGVLKHSLYSEVLISLGKRQIDKAVDAPWKYTVEVSDGRHRATPRLYYSDNRRPAEADQHKIGVGRSSLRRLCRQR
jgi:hypothetical protein